MSAPEGMKQSDKTKDTLWEEHKSQILHWYVTSCSKLPEEQVEKEVVDATGTKKIFWCEPLLEGKNPLLVMGDFGGRWGIKREVIERKPTVFMP